MNYAIIVIDIGMTNKKVAVYDDSLRPTTLPPWKNGSSNAWPPSPRNIR